MDSAYMNVLMDLAGLNKMMWLKLSPSNKNPSEFAYYYLNTVLKVRGVP